MTAHEELAISLGPGGAHHLLASLIGEWEGTTRTWFEPGKLADESPWRGSIRAILGGRFVMHEYRGSLQGEPLEGVAIIGCNLSKKRFETAWVDSFHNGTGIMFSSGEPSATALSVRGAYDDGAGGPPWGWRTEIVAADANHITITAYNITPQGQEAKAVETTYRRCG